MDKPTWKIILVVGGASRVHRKYPCQVNRIKKKHMGGCYPGFSSSRSFFKVKKIKKMAKTDNKIIFLYFRSRIIIRSVLILFRQTCVSCFYRKQQKYHIDILIHNNAQQDYNVKRRPQNDVVRTRVMLINFPLSLVQSKANVDRLVLRYNSSKWLI